MSNQGIVQTRRFAAGRATFLVRCPSEAVKDVVEALFIDLPPPDRSETASEFTLEEIDEHFSIGLGGGPQGGDLAPNAALATLVTSVSRLALDEDPDRLHLHCASLSLRDRGVLISAASGTGKTTLAVALAQRGWTYQSDEAVALTNKDFTVDGFPKPLMIKPGGGDLISGLETARVSLDPDDSLWWHIPASTIPAPVTKESQPSTIVILHRRADGSTQEAPTPQPIHPADAVVALMSQTMDAERFGPDTVVVLSELASRCTCVTLAVGPLEESSSVLEQLVLSHSRQSKVVSLHYPSKESTFNWAPTPNVRSVKIGERVVVHDTAGGAIVALDESGAAVWRALHGDAPDWWHTETMAAPPTISFLDELTSHGLLQQLATTERVEK